MGLCGEMRGTTLILADSDHWNKQVNLHSKLKKVFSWLENRNWWLLYCMIADCDGASGLAEPHGYYNYIILSLML